MKNTIYLKEKMPLIAVFILLLIVASCGSYQYVGVDNDGIYGDTPRTISPTQDVAVTNSIGSNDYYQNYFKSKTLEYERINEEGAIFTDVDSYQSGNFEDDAINNNYQGNGGWGQTNSQVTINVQPSFGWGGMWNSPFYGGFYGNRWNNWGYYDSFYGGFYGNRWNNWGFYDPFYGGFYGGWYNPGFYAFNGYNNYYGSGYYGRGNVSYSATRRNSYPSNSVGSRGATSNNTSRYNNTYRRSNNTVSPNSATSRTMRNASPTVINGNSARRNSNATPSPTYNNNNSTQYRRSTNNSNSSNNNSGNYSRSTNSGNSNSGSYSRPSGGRSNSGAASGGGRRR